MKKGKKGTYPIIRGEKGHKGESTQAFKKKIKKEIVLQ